MQIVLAWTELEYTSLRVSSTVEYAKALPPEARVRIASKAGVSAADPVVREFARFYGRLSTFGGRELGTAFSYAVGSSDDISVWMLMLYDYFVWIATVDCRFEKPN